jgi:hypothetical protein
MLSEWCDHIRRNKHHLNFMPSFPCDKYALQMFWFPCCTHRLHCSKDSYSGYLSLPKWLPKTHVILTHIRDRGTNTSMYVFYALVCN